MLVTYDERALQVAQRVAALVGPSPTLQLETPDRLHPDTFAALAAAVPGNTVVQVLHVTGCEQPQPQVISDAVQRVVAATEALPGLIVRQGLLTLVGAEWDPAEQALARLVDPRQPHAPQSLIVVGRSWQAGALISDDDEVAAAADIVYALITCQSLRGWIADSGVWAASAAAVHYRRELLVAAIAAHHTVQLIDSTLLRTPEASAAYTESGRTAACLRGLDDPQTTEALLRSPVGGSVLTSLRPDPALFTAVPWEALPDALGSYVDDLGLNALRRANEQVQRNADELAADRSQQMERECLDTLRRSLGVAHTRDWLSGVDDRLTELELTAAARDRSADEGGEAADPDIVLRELRRRVERLPYPAAILLRIAAFAAIGAGVGQGWFTAGHGPLAAVFAAAAAAALAAVPLTVKYVVGARRVVALREKFLRRAADRLERQVRSAAAQALAALISQLRACGDSLAGDTDRYEQAMRQLRAELALRARDRDVAPLSAQRFSVFAPPADLVSTEWLSRQFPPAEATALAESLARELVSAAFDLDVPAAQTRVTEVLESAVGHLVWADLATAMERQPLTARTALQVLGEATAPLLRRADFARTTYTVARTVCGDERVLQRLSSAPAGASEPAGRAGQPAALPEHHQHSCEENTVTALSIVDLQALVGEPGLVGTS